MNAETPTPRPSKRTLRLRPEGIVRLLKAASRGDVTIIVDQVPESAALGPVRWNDDDGVLEIDVVAHDWPPNVDAAILVPTYAELMHPTRELGAHVRLDTQARP